MESRRDENQFALSVKGRWLSYMLKCIVVVSAFTGIILSAGAGKGSFMGSTKVFMYFTIQSNIAIALICAIGFALLVRGRRIGRSWFTFKFVGTVSITLTGVVFCLLLAPVLGPYAWNLQNVLTHVIVPVAAVVDFFVTGVYISLPLHSIFYALLPPLAYAVYAGIGYAAGWEFSGGVNYPYFFLNWGSPLGAFGFGGELPYMGCVWWIILFFIFLMAVGWIDLAILSRIRKHVQR